MHELTKLIFDDMKPALGVTEPGAIAFAVSTAKSRVPGAVRQISLRLNSGMYKNAFTCGIPGTSQVGNEYAAALGAIAADSKKGLECLDGITEDQVREARQMIADGKVRVSMSEITSRIFIEAAVTTDTGSSSVTIRDSHTNIVKIVENDRTILEKADEGEQENAMPPLIHRYTLEQLLSYVREVPLEEIQFIQAAHTMNYKLMEEGLESPRTTFSRCLLDENGGSIISEDEQKTASLLCSAAIEARVIGLSRPAMSITGSGAHGIIATMPLYAACQVRGHSEEQLLRATALSYLICMYIKEYSGRLSAFCGCAIAAGTGMACGLTYLRGGMEKEMEYTINNMASSITGMICDGGNQGCVMKGVVAVDAAYRSVDLAMKGVHIDKVHGVNGNTPEETMRYMGLIASPGMVGTEKTIVEILEHKSSGH
ncbi:MAG TPA: serine dehydratase subunit alpha family protein [Candidatus Copromonas faecavium]|uniref:UPF0597 protein IAB28_09930 n=1 Tax=Candidatus Copromonas faecavium (nom. illeg.) TaxID=2840740 RepID=A0A9D1A7I0_9FIRM|nr:serine dehydratase subunit alpha family protein [Candidatus Copromonas faecavium]